MGSEALRTMNRRRLVVQMVPSGVVVVADPPTPSLAVGSGGEGTWGLAVGVVMPNEVCLKWSQGQE